MPAVRLTLVILGILALTTHAPAQNIDFNRDVRPILAGNCFKCHGPDDAVRKGGLRLDVSAMAGKELKSGHTAIVPGDAARSELLSRVARSDDGVMPPPSVGKRLTTAEIAI